MHSMINISNNLKCTISFLVDCGLIKTLISKRCFVWFFTALSNPRFIFDCFLRKYFYTHTWAVRWWWRLRIFRVRTFSVSVWVEESDKCFFLCENFVNFIFITGKTFFGVRVNYGRPSPLFSLEWIVAVNLFNKLSNEIRCRFIWQWHNFQSIGKTLLLYYSVTLCCKSFAFRWISQ